MKARAKRTRSVTVATFKVLDEANQYRIEIVGKFAGFCVRDVAANWKQALRAKLQRPIIVDISRIDGYDSSGRSLLREMHKHGTVIAASTSISLVFLDEITSSRRGSPVLQEAPAARDRNKQTEPKTRIAAAGGE